MEVFKLVGKFVLENTEANQDIDETTGKAKNASNSITSAFKKIGAAVATYFATDKIVSFGRACIETAAEINASTSQFQQTFSVGGEDITKTAQEIIDKVAKSSGILSTRLRDSGTKIYAFAKASGADSAEALYLMESALTAAADTAAYYDRSLEDSTETLQSFLKGNFANDAALGVSCTETTRNAKAMELFGKKYMDLSEIQKQQTLLKMVTDAQAVSGAMGQAAREADGWENVMGNLKEAWKQFQGVLGDPILEKAIPIIQDLTDKVQALPEKVEKARDIFEDFQIKMEKVKNYAERHLSPIIDGVSTAFETVKGWVADATEEFEEWIVSGEAANDIAELLRDAIEFVADAYEAVTTGIQTTRDWLIEHETAVQMAAIAFGTLAVAIGAFTVAQAIAKAGGVVYLAELAATAIGVGALTVAETVATVATTAFGAAIAFVTSPITLVIAAIGALIAIIVLCVKHWDEIMAVVSEVGSKIEETIQKMVDNVTTFLTTFVSNVKAKFESMRAGLEEKVERIKSNVEGKFTEIKENISSKIEEARSNVESTFDTIKSKIEEKINYARDKVEEAINKIKSFFDVELSFKKIKIPKFSISGFFDGDKGTVPTIGVTWEYFAKGGVLQQPTIFGMNGMNPMVGGEAGPEAVAPIDVLQGYVAEAVARQNDGLVYILEKILDAIITMDENMGGNMRDALEGTAFKISNREFGRLVRTVVKCWNN